MVFEKLLLKDFLYFIVFANILIKLMKKIGKMCSLILIFANILPIFYEQTFILLLSYRILVWNFANVFLWPKTLTLCMQLARYRAQWHFLHIAEYGHKLHKYSHYQPKRL